MAGLKYVLTGGLVGGKSALLDALAQTGCATYPEVANDILVESNRAILPRQNSELFAKKWFEKKMKQYDEALGNVCFFDRGLMDPLIIFPLIGKDIPEEYLKEVRNRQYTNPIFLVEPLPPASYGHKWPRTSMTEKESKRYHAVLEKAYRALGYEIFPIPYQSAENRTNLIVWKIVHDLLDTRHAQINH